MQSAHPDTIWSLLRQNLSKGQLSGYALANVVGLTVILAGIMFFADSRHSTSADDRYFSNDYVVMSKKVSGIGFRPVTFSEGDIDDLKRQPWVKRVGRFTSSRFAVNGAVSVGGRSLSSYLFFESVPDEFFDRKPRDWTFSPETPFVPIMLSREYLALYNFGFAVPQGLPQVDENVVAAIPIKLCLTGESQEPEFFDAAIVGFSSRLNTIAVPQSFMEWANARYSSADSAESSRLIVEIDRLRSSAMEDYLKNHDIEVASDNDSLGDISAFLGVVSAYVASNGFIISLLALFILLLSIFLLLEKSREKLRNLMLLGYSPREVGRYYERFVTLMNAVIVALSAVAALLVRLTWQSPLREIGLGGASVLPMLLAASVFFVCLSVVNICVIRTHMQKIWDDE